jgi:hypothetical protein
VKHIVLIHTARQVYLTFEKRLREEINSEIKVNNILDTYFTNDTNEKGHFSQDNLNRFLLALKSAELAGADLIVVLCSVLSQQVAKVVPFISVPIFRIDEKLGSEAILHGSRIMVLASTPGAIGPTSQLILEAAEKAGRKVIIESRYDQDAFDAMAKGDMKTHDERIIQMGAAVRDVDVIVYAQGSMEPTAGRVAELTGLPVITAPSLCIRQIKEFVENEK